VVFALTVLVIVPLVLVALEPPAFQFQRYISGGVGIKLDKRAFTVNPSEPKAVSPVVFRSLGGCGIAFKLILNA